MSKEYQDKMTEFLAKHSRPISKGDSKEYKDNLKREQVLKEIEEFRLEKVKLKKINNLIYKKCRKKNQKQPPNKK